MGSGGYAIKKEKDRPGGATVITLREQDCAPARTFIIFVKDGNIWVTHMADWLMNLLNVNNIRFTCEQADTPKFIKGYVAKLQRRS
jgi:hypothetical protein